MFRTVVATHCSLQKMLSIHCIRIDCDCVMCLLSALGENVYRCPLSSDYAAAQTASLSFHLDRYHFPHWQSSRDLSSPLQPTSSSSSPNPKLRPRSREDWSPATGHYLALESHGDTALLINKQSDLNDKDPGVDVSLAGRTRKSQYEPLDLSVRPESIPSHSAMSPAALVQMSGVFSNGLTSSSTRRLQSYSNLTAEPAYQCDLLVEEEDTGSAQHSGEDEFDQSASMDGRSDPNDDAAKWKMLEYDVLQSEEEGHAGADFQGPGEKHDKLGQWGRAAAESSTSSLENLTPEQPSPLQHQSGLLSFFISQKNLSGAPAGALNATLNGGGDVEKDVASGEHELTYPTCEMKPSQMSRCDLPPDMKAHTAT